LVHFIYVSYCSTRENFYDLNKIMCPAG
jgi:hypothetical protein